MSQGSPGMCSLEAGVVLKETVGRGRLRLRLRLPSPVRPLRGGSNPVCRVVVVVVGFLLVEKGHRRLDSDEACQREAVAVAF